MAILSASLILLLCVTLLDIAHGLLLPTICSGATWTNMGITVAGSSNGSAGSSLSLLTALRGFDVDVNQTLYIADTGNQRIIRWPRGASSGTIAAGQSGVSGSGTNVLNGPHDVKFFNNALYIVEFSNYRALKWPLGANSGTVIVGGNGQGGGINQMGGGITVFVDNAENVYIADDFYHRITRTAVPTGTTTIVAGNNVAGNGMNQLNYAWGSFFDNITNSLYIADFNNQRIVRWPSGASSGTLVAGTTGVAGNTSLLLNNPMAVIFDASGLMYVFDAGNRRVQRFTVGNPTGTTILSFGLGNGANQISSPSQYFMAFDAVGNLYVSDKDNHRIQRYDITCPTTTTSTTTTTSVTTTTTRTTSTTSTTSTSTTTSSTSTTSTTATTSTSTTSATTTTTATTTTSTSATSTTATTSTSATTTTANTTITIMPTDAIPEYVTPIVASIISAVGLAVIGACVFVIVKLLKRHSVTPVESVSNTSEAFPKKERATLSEKQAVRKNQPTQQNQKSMMAPPSRFRIHVIP